MRGPRDHDGSRCLAAAQRRRRLTVSTGASPKRRCRRLHASERRHPDAHGARRETIAVDTTGLWKDTALPAPDFAGGAKRKGGSMDHYLLIESRDPFESNDVSYYYELTKGLVDAGNEVTLL